MSDLSEFHGIDLIAALRDHTHSPRLLLSRLFGLPDTSALAAALRGEPRGWGTDRHLAATTIDAIQNNSWVTVAVSGRKKPRKPKKVWRPKPKKAKRRVLSVADLVKAQIKDD